jgi:hypothetical protein
VIGRIRPIGCANATDARRVDCVERVMWTHRSRGPLRTELSAAVTVAAVLIAGTLAKLGHAWWGFGVMSGLCLASSAIERLTSSPA